MAKKHKSWKPSSNSTYTSNGRTGVFTRDGLYTGLSEGQTKGPFPTMRPSSLINVYDVNKPEPTLQRSRPTVNAAGMAIKKSPSTAPKKSSGTTKKKSSGTTVKKSSSIKTKKK